MNYVELLDFLAVYSLPSIIIAIIVALAKLLCDRFLAKRLSPALISGLTFILSLLLNFGYDCLFVKKAVYFGEETLTAGIIGGSLASLFSALYYKVKSGKITDALDGVELIIEGILRNYVKSDLLLSAVVTVKDLIEEALPKENYDHARLTSDIADAIRECSEDGITDEEIKAVTELTVEAVKQLKNE